MKNNNTIIATVFSLSLCTAANAEIINVEVTNSASGQYFDVSGESEFTLDLNTNIIDEVIGGKDLGSAGSFDSMSDISGEQILFKNGNGSFGEGARSFSRTVVDIEFQNTTNTAFTPTLNSQILPAGMGIYLSECDARNIRTCDSRPAQNLEGENDFEFDDVTNLGGNGVAIESMFNFLVMSDGVELFSLSGSVALVISDLGNFIQTDFDEAQGFLNDFRQTSDENEQTQLSFDWNVTDFEVIFPTELLPGEITNVQYITEVSTFTNTACIQDSLIACPVAYGAFGDPIGRGGLAIRQNEPIDGFDTGLYAMSASFNDGVLTYKADSGPGIGRNITPVSVPSTIAMFIVGLGYILRRAKHTKQ